MRQTRKITSKGQVTIPQDIREQFGFLPDTEVLFEVRDKKVYLRKVSGERREKTRGKKLVDLLRGRATVSMTTDEILSLTRK